MAFRRTHFFLMWSNMIYFQVDWWCYWILFVLISHLIFIFSNYRKHLFWDWFNLHFLFLDWADSFVLEDNIETLKAMGHNCAGLPLSLAVRLQTSTLWSVLVVLSDVLHLGELSQENYNSISYFLPSRSQVECRLGEL